MRFLAMESDLFLKRLKKLKFFFPQNLKFQLSNSEIDFYEKELLYIW